MSGYLEQVGARIRGYRKAAGLTQAMLAAQVGMHTTYVSDIERGQAKNLSVTALHDIGAALGVPVGDLATASGEADSESEEDLAMCTQKIRTLSADRQRFVLGLLRRIVEDIDSVLPNE